MTQKISDVYNNTVGAIRRVEKNMYNDWRWLQP